VSAWAQALAAFCIAFLNNWLAREDVKRTAVANAMLAQLKLDDEALAWLVEHSGHADAARIVRLKPGAGKLELG
jgi:hypothetical protein